MNANEATMQDILSQRRIATPKVVQYAIDASAVPAAVFAPFQWLGWCDNLKM